MSELFIAFGVILIPPALPSPLEIYGSRAVLNSRDTFRFLEWVVSRTHHVHADLKGAARGTRTRATGTVKLDLAERLLDRSEMITPASLIIPPNGPIFLPAFRATRGILAKHFESRIQYQSRVSPFPPLPRGYSSFREHIYRHPRCTQTAFLIWQMHSACCPPGPRPFRSFRDANFPSSTVKLDPTVGAPFSVMVFRYRPSLHCAHLPTCRGVY